MPPDPDRMKSAFADHLPDGLDINPIDLGYFLGGQLGISAGHLATSRHPAGLRGTLIKYGSRLMPGEPDNGNNS